VSAGFFDYDNDGHLDLFVLATWSGTPITTRFAAAIGIPTARRALFPATTCLLYRNRGDGTFEDVSERSGITAKKGRALGVALPDYDGDGFTDIFVSNERHAAIPLP